MKARAGVLASLALILLFGTGAAPLTVSGLPAVENAAPMVSIPPSLKVMTFNLMCDFCAIGTENGTFAERLVAVADTINRHNPDLISLQELRTGEQVDLLLASLFEKYLPIYAEDFGLTYADPTLLVRKNRFMLLEKEGSWLGPDAPDFGFGWKTSFPRRLEYATLRDLSTGQNFIFAGAHFDNNPRNREPSAALLVKKFAASTLPLIFAGDTNLRPDRAGYIALASAFRDTFGEVMDHPIISNQPSVSKDACNIGKGPDFPMCRVDHVLLSKNAGWKTLRWSVDAVRYPSMRGFISDHRAVIVELSH